MRGRERIGVEDMEEKMEVAERDRELNFGVLIFLVEI